MGWMVPMMAAAQQHQTEERLLAELIAKDEHNEHEYKILTAYAGTFRKPERLQEILEEERRAQWQLVMKLDDHRLILRRPRRAQAYDNITGGNLDPYRTQIGSNRVAVMVALVGVVGLMVFGILFLGDGPGAEIAATWPVILTAVASALLFVLLIVIKRARQ